MSNNSKRPAAICLLLLAVMIGGCGTSRPYAVSPEESAKLQNRVVIDGQARYFLSFILADGKWLQPPPTVKGADAYYLVPEKEISLRLLVNYAPKILKGFGVEQQYEIFVPSVKILPKAGETYVIGARVAKGKALVWIEDGQGNPVTDQLPGMRLAYPRFIEWQELPPPVR